MTVLVQRDKGDHKCCFGEEMNEGNDGEEVEDILADHSSDDDIRNVGTEH